MKRLQGLAAAPGVVRGPWVRIDPAPAPAGGRIDPEAAAGEIERLREASAGRGRRARGDRRDASTPMDTPTRRRSSRRRRASPAIRPSRDGRRNGSTSPARMRSRRSRRRPSRSPSSCDRSTTSCWQRGRRTSSTSGNGSPGGSAAQPDTAGEVLDRPAVVVADDLPPSVTATLPRERLLGIALEGSSPTAHAAILARAYGIPAVVGAGDLLETLRAEGEGGRSR